MKWFNRKKKTEEAKEQERANQDINKASYKIVICEKLGGTIREIKTLDAERWVDSEDHVVYLRNEKLKFLEIFPQQIQDFKNYDIDEVESLITDITAKLKRERKQDSEEVNDKDLEFELLKLRAKQRSFRFNPRSSYLTFDEKGRPTFTFLREGSTFFPFKYDTDTNTVFVPSDNRKKSASIALRNKDSKYSTQKIVTGVQIFLLIIQVVGLFATGYGFLKIQQQGAELFVEYDESNIAAAQRACLEDIGKVSNTVKENAETVNRIFDEIDTEINKPQTVIEGVIPE